MIVLDASVVVEMLLRPDACEPIFERLSRRGESLHAPHLLDVEVAHVLRRAARDGVIDERHGRMLVGELAALPISRYAHQPLLPRIWALRSQITAYDAAYVALAEALDAPLLTRDAKLATAAPLSARVERV
ncbi:MAG TPA: type II toxin-antitoxin system VapC family toxin [Caulobacteraceae bacterium]|nr:type II toxin-antitoxin system VapC family toxin [Caulobacteraceae bacterium]